MPSRGRSGPRPGQGRREGALATRGPPILDGILAAWERFDRRRRGIRPARPGAIVGLELRRHRGEEVRLEDGTVVHRGDLVGEVHFDNARIRAGLATAGWLRVLHPARGDLDAIARWSASLPISERPVAYHGVTILWPLAKHVGFEVMPRRRTPYVRLDEWFLRWLLVHWSIAGRARLAHGRSPLRSAHVWLSRGALEARLGRS